MKTTAREMMRNAYISIELKDRGLTLLRRGLQAAFVDEGIAAEEASRSLHVSIAYGEGSADVESLAQAMGEIAAGGFQVSMRGFEILEGQTTPFDYLVATLDADGDLGGAISAAQNRMTTKDFSGGFKTHVSLLKFPKGTLLQARAEELVRELNASHGAAFVLGRCLSVEGECVCLFNPERECCLQMRILESQAA